MIADQVLQYLLLTYFRSTSKRRREQNWPHKARPLIQLSRSWTFSSLVSLRINCVNCVNCGRRRRGARNPNLQVVITHASPVCSQHSFGLPLTMNGMHKTQFDHARLDPLPLVIWSRVFSPSVTWNLRKAQRLSKSVLTSSIIVALTP